MPDCLVMISKFWITNFILAVKMKIFGEKASFGLDTKAKLIMNSSLQNSKMIHSFTNSINVIYKLVSTASVFEGK